MATYLQASGTYGMKHAVCIVQHYDTVYILHDEYYVMDVSYQGYIDVF